MLFAGEAFVAGTVTVEYVIVNVLPLPQVMLRRIVHGPDPEIPPAGMATLEHDPRFTAMYPAEPDEELCGAVQPAGTVTETWEPLPNVPADVKVNVNGDTVAPPVAVFGEMLIWPSPLASVNDVCASHFDFAPAAVRKNLMSTSS